MRSQKKMVVLLILKLFLHYIIWHIHGAVYVIGEKLNWGSKTEVLMLVLPHTFWKIPM